MTIEAFLAALGLKGLPTVVVGAVGSLVSVHFGEGGIGQRATTFAGGCAIAWWGGPQVAAYSETTKYEIGIVLLCGLFGMPAVRLELFVEPLNAALSEFMIDTFDRQTAFLAQVAHESAGLRYLRELADGLAYEPPSHLATHLGNTQAGDGPRFKGRGLLQITGRKNYGLAAAKACSASVDRAREVGEAAIAGTAELVAAAKRLSAPAVHTVERIEKILSSPRRRAPAATRRGTRSSRSTTQSRGGAMTARILLLCGLATGCAALAACSSAVQVPERVSVEVPVACVSAADVPPRPAVRTEADLMAMDRYRRTLAAWSDLKSLEAYSAKLEAIAQGCSRIPARGRLKGE
jgi:hypothetical protein